MSDSTMFHILNTNEPSVQFQLEISLAGYAIFADFIKKEHYLFNPDLMLFRTAYLNQHGVEYRNIKTLSTKKLTGFIQKISLMNFRTGLKTIKSVVDVDDLELFYEPERNEFRFKLLSSVSDPFDYLAICRKAKGA
ncbi:MAG: hypothetical protein LC127_16910 [Chitinophagales bacterium]|nr:hypothetical protein [Chitinophagales bacterium]